MSAELRVDDWKYGTPHDYISSNPAVVSSGFRRGERERVEMLLVPRRQSSELLRKLAIAAYIVWGRDSVFLNVEPLCLMQYWNFDLLSV
jgi:hypothetical protein